MARIELAKSYPFTQWDAAKKDGKTERHIFVTIEYETAKSKGSWNPFFVKTSWRGIEERFSLIDDAVAYKNEQVRAMAMQCGWTPESEYSPYKATQEDIALVIDLADEALENRADGGGSVEDYESEQKAIQNVTKHLKGK